MAHFFYSERFLIENNYLFLDFKYLPTYKINIVYFSEALITIKILFLELFFLF